MSKYLYNYFIQKLPKCLKIFRSGSPRLNSHSGAVTKNSSRSSSSSAGLVHKPQVTPLSSAYDPLEFQLGQQHPPIDAITGVVSHFKLSLLINALKIGKIVKICHLKLFFTSYFKVIKV